MLRKVFYALSILLCATLIGPSFASAIPTADLTFWLKADSVLATNGAPIPTWNDSSASALNVSQSDPALQPIYVENVLNGMPVVRFDGSDFLRLDNVLGSDLTSPDQATIFIVQKQDGNDPQNTTLAWGTSTYRLLLHLTWQDAIAFHHGNPAGGGSLSDDQPVGWDDTFHLIEARRAGSVAEINIDGSRFDFGSMAGLVDTTIHETLYVGNDRFGNTFSGDLAEVIVYSRALSATEISEVYQYLNAKYLFGATGPVPDIKANASDGPVSITQNDVLSVTVGLAANNLFRDDADWWILADTGFGWYYYVVGSNSWKRGQAVTYQGPLFDIGVAEVLKMKGLPVGSYIFYFGVDMLLDGALSLGEMYYDRVRVTIAP